MPYYLGIDTSNYTTSAAVFDSQKMCIRDRLYPEQTGNQGRKITGLLKSGQDFPCPLFQFFLQKITKRHFILSVVCDTINTITTNMKSRRM